MINYRTIKPEDIQLSLVIEQFQHEGILAEPIMISDNEVPDAVVIPYSTWQASEASEEALEDLLIAPIIRSRILGSSSPVEISDLAVQLGLNPNNFR